MKTDSPSVAPVGPPRRCALKFLFVVGVLGLGALVFAYWYLVKCAGTWQGVPLESKHVADLQALKERLKADVAYLQDLGPRNSEDDTTYARLRTCAAWIAKEWQTQGYAVRTQEFTVGDKPYANLEIEIPGTTAPSEIVIISAQYDTLPGSPGANNNASGVATLLRLSELLKGRQGDRTVRLVQFVNEEEPFFGTEQMGSYVYARACRERGEDIRAMLSLDAIGIYKHTPGSQKLPWPFSWCYPDKGDFLAFIANAPSRGCVKVATRGFRKGSAFPIRAGVVPEWVDGASWSDHSSFWRLGYPGVQVTDTGALRSASHTTPEDTLEKIDFDALSRITLGIYGATLELARKENELSPLDLPSHWLFFNGVIVLLAGLLAGLALWQAILWNLPTAAYQAWRVAHATLMAQGLLMLVVALGLPRLALSHLAVWLVVWCLTAAGYGFAVAMTLGAWTGLRGLGPKPWGLNTVLFVGHAVGALGSSVAVGVLLRGALETL